jgi:Transglycosylase SLT domain
MPPVSPARRRALRAVLSALAGGGLTAASLGGPLTASAFGATVTGTSSPPEATTTTPATTGTAETQPPASTQPTTSTSTPVPAPTTTAPSETTSVPAPPPPETPVVVLQRRQKTTHGGQPNPNLTATKTTPGTATPKKATGPNNVAGSPQAVAQAGALAALLATSDASAQALAFYRIPLFLLPIYKAAAVQYGVPWQILAAVNEIETNYGTDQAVSSAGAVGWMQFMPSTWLQYGVDALDAGYADPYSPVDAIFAAARYLRAAGAATDLHGAILAYNHSEEYVSSVLLRAKLISTYPKAVIATLTGLVDGRLPVSSKHLAWNPAASVALPSSTATANTAAVSSHSSSPAPAATATPAPPLSPAGAAAAAKAKSAAAAARLLQLVELTSIPNASVVAVQDGRIVQIGHSRGLGRYVILRDVYGDVFTYAGLGSVAPNYKPAKAPRTPVTSPAVEAASKHDPAPSQAASAGSQAPLTLQVKTPAKRAPASHRGAASLPTDAAEEGPTGLGKVRLFAHPGNPDALASAAARASRLARTSKTPQRLPLRRGAVVSSGTVLGHVSMPAGARAGHLRFAIRPAGDPGTIDPGPILANWAQLQAALHPRGATSSNALLGATASNVFLQSKSELQRAVLADPGITLAACDRKDVAAGSVDRRLLAVLAFLSRSGLKPTVGALRCEAAAAGAAGSPPALDALEVTAINGIRIAHHQGAGTITDLAIRTLLTLPGEFIPHQIVSLMRYPGAANTHATASAAAHIRLEFLPARPGTALRPAAVGKAAHSAKSGSAAPAPLVTTTVLSAAQWNQLVTRVGALPAPKVATKPSSSAIVDPKHP